MEYKLSITDSADRDMDMIYAYIMNHLCNPKAATDSADAIEVKYEEVCSNPYMYKESRNYILKK